MIREFQLSYPLLIAFKKQVKEKHSRPEPDSEEDSDEEQQSAYQKLLSTMIQGADDNSEDEESDDGEEVEGKLLYSLIVSTFPCQLQC